MKMTVRRYDHASDYEKVGCFLERAFDPSGSHVNWSQPRWEYMHHTDAPTKIDLNAIGVWESQGIIVGVVHPEDRTGTVYVEVDAEHAELKRDMLAYAEGHLFSMTEQGRRRLQVYINDRDDEFQTLARETGYVQRAGSEPMSQFAIPDPFPAITLPEGYRLQSLAEEYNIEELATATWRGFNHEDDPPPDNVEWRERLESAPGFRRDLHMMAVAPDGSIAAYCGMWIVSTSRMAYVEPVCTVPEYRRMGLGRAAVREGVRRSGLLGAIVAYVGSSLPFYGAIGFTLAYNRSLWMREWE
jgi:predicted N-acetyltransferase YhbS